MEQMSNEDELQPVRKIPLKHKKRVSRKYSLDNEVKAQIREALVMDGDQLLQRARAKRNSSGFLREETLVYLIREYLSAKAEDDLVLEFKKILEERTRASINNRFFGLDRRLAEQLIDNVTYKILTELFSPPYKHGDFMEAKFLMYVYYRAIDERRRYGDEDGPKYRLVPLTNEDGEDLDIPKSKDFKQPPDQLPLRELEDQAITNHLRREVLPKVITNPNHFEAYILRNYYGWQIESKDDGKQTLSKHFGVDPRTIRYWLRKANNQVDAWRKGQGHGKATE
jgi:hypothetical protein